MTTFYKKFNVVKNVVILIIHLIFGELARLLGLRIMSWIIFPPSYIGTFEIKSGHNKKQRKISLLISVILMNINTLFQSGEFTEFLMDIEFLDQFEEGRMTGHNFTRIGIQKFTLIKRNSEKLLRKGVKLPTYRKMGEEVYDLSLDNTNYNEYNLSKYLYDFENMTVLYENGDKYKNFGSGLHLPAYFKIKPLK